MTSQESKVDALKDTISRLHVSLHSMSRRHTGREELVRELVEATKELKGLGWEVTTPDKATGVVNYYPASHLGRLEGILSGSIQVPSQRGLEPKFLRQCGVPVCLKVLQDPGVCATMLKKQKLGSASA